MYRALRRHYNTKKAIRKRNISRHVNGFEWYDNLHQYSDNKVHCSCGMCRFKNAYESDHQSMQDIRSLEKMKAREALYEVGELSNNDPITDSYYNRVS